MRDKRGVLWLLAGLNAVLVVTVIATRPGASAVYGQVSGRPGDFICVTAKAVGQSYDVVYVLDVPARRMHAMYPSNAQTRQLTYAQSRDLEKDFRKK